MKASKKAYELYRSIDDMHTIVFDIYHDMLYDSLQQVYYMIADEDDYSQEISSELEKMKNMVKSAEYLSKVYK